MSQVEAKKASIGYIMRLRLFSDLHTPRAPAKPEVRGQWGVKHTH